MSTHSVSIKTIVRELSHSPSRRMPAFRALTLEQKKQVLHRATSYIRQDIIKKLTDEELKDVLEVFDPVEATDLLQTLPKKKRDAVVELLNESLRHDLGILLSFDPDTAAGLMNLDYIRVQVDDSIKKIAEKVRVHEEKTGKVPLILLLNKDKLEGFLPGHKLILAHPTDAAKDHLKKIATLKHSDKQDQVLRFFKTNPHQKAVVLGENDTVLGVIYSDDIIRILEEQESRSLYDFAGVQAAESIYDSVKRKVGFRYKWLILNLGTAFLAAFTVGLFDETIEKQVLLAVYMPIVAGMGGNAGTQTLAVMVRGLSNLDVGAKEVLYTLRNEVFAGLINGSINGLIVFLIVWIFNHNLLVATVLGIAMILNLLIASTFGTLVPVLMEKLGKDPASSATIFITTATDIFGFMAFLGLATILLR